MLSKIESEKNGLETAEEEIERKFFDAVENPKPATEELKDVYRAYGKYVCVDASADLEAANKRADEAEALVRMLEDAETVEIMQTLRARVEELEAALRTIACHPIENFCMGRPDLGIPGYASCQDVARAVLKGASHEQG